MIKDLEDTLSRAKWMSHPYNKIKKETLRQECADLNIPTKGYLKYQLIEALAKANKQKIQEC